jgi:hypothetical protein
VNNHLIDLEFKVSGDSYSVELRAGVEGKAQDIIITTNIPAFDPHRYDRYRQACRKLYDRARLGLKSISVTTAVDLAQIRQNLDESADNLLDTLRCPQTRNRTAGTNCHL